MGIFRSLALAAILAFSLSLTACGGSSEMTPEQQKEYNDFWSRSSLGFHVQNGGAATDDSNIVTEEPKPTTQVMVQGVVKAPGYAGGAITLEVREAEACAEGYCPVEGKAPLAAASITAPGFFSLIVPSQGQKTTLVAAGAGQSAMHYLGELSAKVDGVTLTLK